eukprot:CAMPEP_0174714670 /NCGR_PEP_ID=MMETSP1094-20130205/18654_1 /TAXON_ID=156173 /ORGANISM="Chrysochromulina brevifilum, Strain UTEX LB 985" /LENGTH=187 /DNA_ID=CAMNT_0015914071 /DNA_START=82 /DNA_END=642 /DNA_ORIENTATION=+
MSFTQDMVAEIIDEEGADNLTAKTVRQKLEAKLGLESGALKSKKDDIAKMIDDVLNARDDNEEDEEEEEEEEEAPPAKKAKKGKEPAAKEENPNKGKMTCTTRSGEEAPKNIKKVQETMKMSKSKFLNNASALEVDVDGNTLRGEPRSFSSGAMGWYLGGKVEMSIGGQTVWAQVGMNVVIPGSNAW